MAVPPYVTLIFISQCVWEEEITFVLYSKNYFMECIEKIKLAITVVHVSIYWQANIKNKTKTYVFIQNEVWIPHL